MPHKKYRSILLAGVIILVVLIAVATRLGSNGNTDTAEESAEISQGVAFLTGLEAKDPADVDQILKEQRLQRLQEMRDERMRQLESGEISVWSLFEDYVLCGDSRAVGFSFFGFLPEDRVLAESGATILKLEERIPDIVALNPSNIFLCYGLNDVFIGIWPTPEDYVTQYAEIIAEIQAQLPDANIFISSILPARDPAFQKSTAWYNIPQYSSAVKGMCDSTAHCYYVDNDAIADEYASLWEVDGIHVQRDFYPHWAANLITEVYSVSLEDEDTQGTQTAASGSEATGDSGGSSAEPGT